MCKEILQQTDWAVCLNSQSTKQSLQLYNWKPLSLHSIGFIGLPVTCSLYWPSCHHWVACMTRHHHCYCGNGFISCHPHLFTFQSIGHIWSQCYISDVTWPGKFSKKCSSDVRLLGQRLPPPSLKVDEHFSAGFLPSWNKGNYYYYYYQDSVQNPPHDQRGSRDNWCWRWARFSILVPKF